MADLLEKVEAGFEEGEVDGDGKVGEEDADDGTVFDGLAAALGLDYGVEGSG